MTKLMYIKHPDLFELSAQITQHGSDDKGVYLVLNQSLFYPQGGGQPADQGKIITANTCYEVFDVRNVVGEIRHYITHNNAPVCPVDAVIKIDKERRILNSKYHTAGHLIAAVVEQENPALKAIKGHQFPGEAYVEFFGNISDADSFMTQTISRLYECIASKLAVKTEELSAKDVAIIAPDLPYELPKKEGYLRVCQIEGFTPVPCGGTHIKTLEEVSSLAIKKCKSKKGKTKIYYEA